MTNLPIDHLIKPGMPVPRCGTCRTIFIESAQVTVAKEPAKSRKKVVTEYAKPVPDIAGHALTPNPMRATTTEEFMDAMRDLHLWAGKPSIRELDRRCDEKISYSTFRIFLNSTKLPKIETMQVFIRILGGTEEDVLRWTLVWRRIAMGKTSPKVVPRLVTRARSA